MHPEEFNDLAIELSSKPGAANARTAISRAYYSTFHSINKLLKMINHALPKGPQGHQSAYSYLNNSGDTEMVTIAGQLNDLRHKRNEADYDLDKLSIENINTAKMQVKIAGKILSKLNACEIQDGRLSDIKLSIEKFRKSR